jgi:hypothetical protein
MQCRVLSDDLAVHWWKIGTKPGDLCMCGMSPRTDEGYDFDDGSEDPFRD